MKTSNKIALLAALTLTALAAPAAAEQRRAAENKTEQGYAYTFEDDPLAAPGMDMMNGMIKVRPKAARNTLIRPRLHFVTEMLKSVEML
jgi:uncharacterized membrane protein